MTPPKVPMKNRKRRSRKQPRKLTPPIYLRLVDRPDALQLFDPACKKTIVAVDEHLNTDAESWCTNMTTAYIHFGPGLTIRLSSKAVNKYRYPVIIVERQKAG